MSVATLPVPDQTPDPAVEKLARAQERHRLMVAQWGADSLEAGIAELAVSRARRAVTGGEM